MSAEAVRAEVNRSYDALLDKIAEGEAQQKVIEQNKLQDAELAAKIKDMLKVK